MSIATEISRLQTAKANLKTAIEDKGVTVGDVKLDEYYTKVNAIPVSPTPTTIKSKCYTKTLSADQTSGTLEMTSADSDIAQHRTDTSFTIAISYLGTPDTNTLVFGFSTNVNHNTTGGANYYGILSYISSYGGVGTSNVTSQASSTSANIYADSSGKIIVKPSSSRIYKTGEYLIICGWE